MSDKKDRELEFLRGMQKLKAAPVRDEGYTSPLENDTMQVRGSKPEPETVTRIAGATEHIDTKSAMPMTKNFQSKIQALLQNKAAKKALGILPMAGTIAGLAAGDPAMAAEEAAGDIPVAGQIYEAIKPTESGNPEEERQMIAARNLKGIGPKYVQPEGLEEGKPQRNIFSKLFGGMK